MALGSRQKHPGDRDRLLVANERAGTRHRSRRRACQGSSVPPGSDAFSLDPSAGQRNSGLVMTAKQLSNHLHAAQTIVRKLGAVWFVVALLYFVSGLISPGMFQFSQAINICQVAAFLGVVATGQTIALLTGGIDL